MPLTRRPLARAAALLLAACSPQPGPAAPEPSASAAPPPPSASQVVESDEPPAIPAEPVLAASALFTDDPKAFPRRALFSSSPAVRWTPDARAATLYRRTSSAPDGEQIVAEHGPRFTRILVRHQGARVAFYVPTSELSEVVRASTPARPKHGSYKDAAVILRAGARPTWKDTRIATSEHPRERYFVLEGDPRLEGWLPEAAIARVFLPEASEGPGTHLLEGASQVLDGPNGAPLAKIDPSVSRSVRLLGAAKDGHQKIALTTSDARLEAWVPAAKLKPDALGLGAFGHGRGWGGSHWGTPTKLDPGTKLHATASGDDQVGLLAEAHTVFSENHSQEGRRRANVHLGPWGLLEVWIPEAAFDAAQKRDAAEAKRLLRVELSGTKISAGFDDPAAVLAAQRGAIALCAEAAEKGKRGGISGKLTLRLSLDGNGKTTKVEVGGALAKDAALKACLEKLAPSFNPREPRPASGTLDVTVALKAP